jgi:hypothetical protein
VCEEKRRRPIAMRGLPGALFGDSQEPVPPTTYLGNARQNAWSPDIHQAGPPERLSTYPNQRRRRI